MSRPHITRAQAHRNARAVLDTARARRDSLCIADAARAAAVGSNCTAEEIERRLRRLKRMSEIQPQAHRRQAQPAEGTA
ncbi:hypothetical protein [Streptomyces sp. cg36]|uniref:hypothetical protein n=1 Tax=Streptomyces sp. cg36 TaxID=3238798 RepID=UPI0034E29498